MTTQSVPICGEHKILKDWRKTTFEYIEEGVTIRMPDVYAWVCPGGNEASFKPETVDELIVTMKELIEIAKRSKKRRSVLTEYIVSVG